MFALQYVSGLLVVERFDIPLDQGEIFAVVFRVAACALLARAAGNVINRVQSLAGIESRGNFGMAIQTLQRRLPTELVAGGAVRRSIERFVRPRQRSRRDLRCRRG